MNVPSQHNVLAPHLQKGYSFQTTERSKSPINTQINPQDKKISPIKHPVYLQNHHHQRIEHQRISNIQPQQGTQIKPGTPIIEKENVKLILENKNNPPTEHNIGSDSKIHAIDRIIQNCNIMNLNSPTKQNINNQQHQWDKRISAPVQPNINQHHQTVENHQTYNHNHNLHQQIQQRPITAAQQNPHTILQPVQPQVPLLQNPYVNPHQQIQTIQQQLMCSNNDNKKAKYARFDNPQQLFCAKCSIALVGMGIKMVDIQNQQNTRQKQLKGFIAQVNNIKNNIAKQINCIQGQKNRVSLHVNNQRQELIKRYSEIINILKQFQSRDLAVLHQFQEESLKKLSDFDVEFRKSWDKLDLMVRDISPNIEMIKVHISEQQFKQFMQDYYSQIKSICGRIDTFNLCCLQTKPFIVKRESFQRLNYQSFSQLAKQNKNVLYFSFERKTSDNQEQNVGMSQCQELPPRIQIKSEQSWKRDQQPFRVLFTEEETKQQNPSPSFKKL